MYTHMGNGPVGLMELWGSGSTAFFFLLVFINLNGIECSLRTKSAFSPSNRDSDVTESFRVVLLIETIVLYCCLLSVSLFLFRLE